MEKDRIAFVEEKKRKNLIKLKIIETLKFERNALRDRLNAIQDGPHAKRTLEVSCPHLNMRICIMISNHRLTVV